MKSPLVEALRQASGKSSTSEQSEPDSLESSSEESPDVASAAETPDPGDLQLMESTAVLPIDGDGILPIDGGGILPIDGHGILPIDGAAETGDEEPDAGFYETTSMEIGDDDASSSGPLDEYVAVAPPLRTAPHTRHRSGMSRLGLFSPLICLALAATATGIYFGYQSLSGWYHNVDLEALSSQFGSVPAQDAADVLVPDQVESRFKLIVGPQNSVRSDIRIDSARQNPNAAHLQFALGTLFAQQSRWANARHAFDQASRLDATNADYLFNLAVSLEHLGQYIDARFYYESALDAASATSTLDSDIVAARIERLALITNPESVSR